MRRNEGYSYRERLPDAASGRTLLDYLVARYRHSDAAAWRARIDAGQLLLNGRVATPGMPLRAGQALVWHRPPWREPEVPRSFAILHQDRDLMAVAKPAGLPTMPAGGFLKHTLLAMVRSVSPAAAPLHRLGRWTSGLVLFALTPQARGQIARAWRAGRVGKRYRALASGRPEWSGVDIDVPIGEIPHARLGSIHAACPHGRPSSSHVEVVELRDSGFLADVEIATGRPHQIRVHLASVGHPLVGDPLYVTGGRPAPGSTALPGDPGYRLHAAELRLRHPVTGSRLVLRCAPPPELRRRPSVTVARDQGQEATAERTRPEPSAPGFSPQSFSTRTR